MPAVLPVVIYQAVAPGAQFFPIEMHDSGSIIGRILIVVLNQMTIEAAIIGTVF